MNKAEYDHIKRKLIQGDALFDKIDLDDPKLREAKELWHEIKALWKVVAIAEGWEHPPEKAAVQAVKEDRTMQFAFYRSGQYVGVLLRDCTHEGDGTKRHFLIRRYGGSSVYRYQADDIFIIDESELEGAIDQGIEMGAFEEILETRR